MININNNVSYVKYETENPLYKRINKMKENHLKGEKNIIYIVPNRYNTSIRYRSENMIKTINRLPKLNASLFEMVNINVVLSNLYMVDIIIFQRVICYEIREYLNQIQKKKIPVLYDIDDFVFSSKCKNYVSNKKVCSYYGKSYEEIIEQVDMIITSTEYLKLRLSEEFSKKIFKINNYMDDFQYSIAKKIRQNKNVNVKQQFIIGYFGGDTHFRDLEMVSPMIVSFLEKHKNAKIKIVGMKEIPLAFKQKDISNQIELIPYMDGYKLMYEYADVNVNIIPLVMDEFSESRSEIKYFEAASVGVVSIASPTQVYKKIAEESNSIILSDVNNWSDELEMVYSKKHNMGNMVKNAIKYVESHYTEETMLPVLNNFVDDVGKNYGKLLYLGNG